MISSHQPILIDKNFDPNKGIKIITSFVVAIVVTLTFIFLVKTYSEQKEKVENNMEREAKRIEKIFVENIEYTTRNLEQIATQIRKCDGSTKAISKILSIYKTNSKVSSNQPWTVYSWINTDNKLVANSNTGIMRKPLDHSDLYVLKLTREKPNIIHFGAYYRGRVTNKTVLPVVMGVYDNNNKFRGVLSVGLNVKTIKEKLKAVLRENYTNFSIIDGRLHVLFSSKNEIPGLSNYDNIINDSKLTNAIKKMDFFNNNAKKAQGIVNIWSGENYYLSKLDDLPFILYINTSPDEIGDKIFRTVIHKFIEISIFSSFFLILIIAIYKRETWLKYKAEKATEIAVKATRAKTEYLSYSAHEIRSPLGFIITGSEIMKNKLFGPISDKYLEYIEGIHQNANSILDFITDILDETHILEGNFKIDDDSVNLVNIIDRSIDYNLTRFVERKVEISKSIDPKLPLLYCDRRRILQALNNLITNAIKYSEDNTTITISAYLNANNQIILTVADQGVGMNSEDISIALKRHGRTKNKSYTMVASYGLGLPIVKKLSEAHNAELEIKSTKGHGTTISIIFPSNRTINDSK